jgi:hypothetical protein
MNKTLSAVLVASCLTFASGQSQAFLDNLLSGGNSQTPPDGNPSPSTSAAAEANKNADKALYKPIEYANAAVQGPTVVVIPGEIKSSNATFTQKLGPNNIADFGELELTRANFRVLERSDLGPLLQEFQLAYSMGDPQDAARFMKKGKFKSTKWVIKFDVLKAEQVATAKQGFDGQAVAGVTSTVGALMGFSMGGLAAGQAVGTVKTDDSAQVWIVGLRYKIINATTTEQMASGYVEDKMEIGAKSATVMGVSQGASGGLTLDSLVQRLVQSCVAEMDARYKTSR